MKHLTPLLLLALATAACSGGSAPQSAEAPCAGVDCVDQGAATKDKGKLLYYKHPMGLPDTSPTPKKDSMGMDYIPVYESDLVGAPAGGIAVASNIIQTIGVRTSPAEMHEFGRSVRAFGVVEENTRLQTAISARVEGWVENLAISAIGDNVKSGDLLFRLFSPDLIAAQRDYLVAVNTGAEGRIESAARRLKSLGLQDQSIDALRKTRRLEERAPIFAERDGVVSALDVREGTFLRPGDRVATIQDYSKVWIIASLAEQDLWGVKAGMHAMLDFPNIPDAARHGMVDYVYPTVDPKTRTGRVRIVLDNDDDTLRPGAYADVSFNVEARERLAVPSEAVLYDAQGAHVVLALGGGRFAPAAIETGISATGFTEVLSGLVSGDEVVISAQFLLDSESSLRESLRKLTNGDTPQDPAASEHDHRGHN